MIALKFITIAQVLLILFTDKVLSYPTTFYNTKHFRQSSHRPVYDPYDYYTRTQRYPYGYYPSYSQVYPDEYYYNQDAYPLYYVSPRGTKYDLYPYYQDEGLPRSKYYGDGSLEDPEKVIQELEREQRERAQPIGHEIRYDTDYNTEDEGSVDEANAAFLNNLMLQQLYMDNLKEKIPVNSYPDQYPYNDYTPDDSELNRWNDVPYDRPVIIDDEDVKELKELPKKQQKERKNKQRKQRKPKNNEKRSGDDAVVLTDRKPVVKDPAPSVAPDSLADGSRRNIRGQKEEVMMRPATPVRHPFSDSVLDMLSQQQDERKRSPSVYDKIRYMLEMEKNEDQGDALSNSDLKPSMRKRIVSSEDSLTRQLTVLKKTQ